MSQPNVASCIGSFVGRRLVAVGLRDYTWFFDFGPRLAVATDGEWRLVAKGRVTCSSSDHGHKFGLPAPVDAASIVRSTVADAEVAEARIEPAAGDLVLEFPNDTHLEFLQLSSGYESWHLTVQETEIICTGGGKIVLFSGNRGA